MNCTFLNVKCQLCGGISPWGACEQHWHTEGSGEVAGYRYLLLLYLWPGSQRSLAFEAATEVNRVEGASPKSNLHICSQLTGG